MRGVDTCTRLIGFVFAIMDLGMTPVVTRVLFAGLVGLHVVRHMLLVVVTRGRVETYNASASVMSV